MHKLLLLSTLLISSLLLPASAQTLELGRFKMDCSQPSAEVTRLGVEAVDTHWPADKSFEECTAHLIVVDFDAETTKMMSEDGGDPFAYGLTTYLAVYGEPDSTEETQFMGATGERKVYQSGVPRDHTLHVFSRKMADDSFVMVGLRVFEANEETTKLLQCVANSFGLKD